MNKDRIITPNMWFRNKDGIITAKMWFKNGTYIVKEIEIKETCPKDEIKQFISEVQNMVKKSFITEGWVAQITLQGMIIRVSELIAIDFDFPAEEEQEEEKTEEVWKHDS